MKRSFEAPCFICGKYLRRPSDFVDLESPLWKKIHINSVTMEYIQFCCEECYEKWLNKE